MSRAYSIKLSTILKSSDGISWVNGFPSLYSYFGSEAYLFSFRKIMVLTFFIPFPPPKKKDAKYSIYAAHTQLLLS